MYENFRKIPLSRSGVSLTLDDWQVCLYRLMHTMIMVCYHLVKPVSPPLIHELAVGVGSKQVHSDLRHHLSGVKSGYI